MRFNNENVSKNIMKKLNESDEVPYSDDVNAQLDDYSNDIQEISLALDALKDKLATPEAEEILMRLETTLADMINEIGKEVDSDVIG